MLLLLLFLLLLLPRLQLSQFVFDLLTSRHLRRLLLLHIRLNRGKSGVGSNNSLIFCQKILVEAHHACLRVRRLFLVKLLLKLSHQLVVRVKLHLDTVSVGHKTFSLPISLSSFHFSLSVLFLHLFPRCILLPLSAFSMKNHLLDISRWTLLRKLWQVFTYIILSFLSSHLLCMSKLILFGFHVIIKSIIFVCQRIICDYLGCLIGNLLLIVAFRLFQQCLY